MSSKTRTMGVIIGSAELPPGGRIKRMDHTLEILGGLKKVESR